MDINGSKSSSCSKQPEEFIQFNLPKSDAKIEKIKQEMKIIKKSPENFSKLFKS